MLEPLRQGAMLHPQNKRLDAGQAQILPGRQKPPALRRAKKNAGTRPALSY